MVVGVPIGSDEHEVERAGEVVKEESSDRLARQIARMPDTQAAALITSPNPSINRANDRVP